MNELESIFSAPCIICGEYNKTSLMYLCHGCNEAVCEADCDPPTNEAFQTEVYCENCRKQEK